MTDYRLEQYLLGELDSAQIAEVEADPNTVKRLRTMREENQTILRDYPAHAQLPQIIRQLDQSRSEGLAEALKQQGPSGPRLWNRPGLVRRGLGLVAAAGFVLVAGLLIGGLPATEPEATRVKGGSPELILYAPDSDGSARELAENEAVSPATLLQVAYRAGSATHGVVFSVDGNGTVTRHLPEQASGSTLLDPDGETRLPFAYRLDDAPMFEDFVFLTSGEAIPVDEVERILRQAAGSGRLAPEQLPLPDGISVRVFRLAKDGTQ